MSDLTAIAEEFKKWKGNLSHCRYPSHLWEQVYAIKDRYPIKAIASALGMSVQYLERKFAARPKAVSFASVQVTALPDPIKIEFKQITLHANANQIASVIQALVGEV